MKTAPSAACTMAGKTCLVTGATSGLGRAAALALAQRGARVVLIGRDGPQAAATAQAFRSATGNPAIEFLTADLSSQAQVRRVAAEFLQRFERLDVLVNNVGGIFARRRESIDGLEMTLALNHLAPFLLTGLLLDKLKASAPARIIMVSSGAHKDAAAFDFDDPQARSTRRRYGSSELSSLAFTIALPWKHPGFVQYAQTKLANLLFMRELATRLDGSGVTINAMHPGLVRTRISTRNGSFGRFMGLFLRITGVTPEQGARTIVYLACSPEVASISGRYFINDKPVGPSVAAQDDAAAKRLWRLSEELTSVDSGNETISRPA